MAEINKETVKCPVCGEDKYQILFQNEDFLYGIEGTYQAAECSRCKVWYQNPQPKKESTACLYPDYYGPYALGKGAKGSIHTNMRKQSVLAVLEEFNFSKVRKWSKLDYRIINLIPNQKKDEKLLEIGCANGSRLFQLQADGFTNLYGTDITNAAQDSFRARKIDFKCGDALDVLKSYEDQTFQTVIMSMTLEHLKEPVDVIKQICRILRPGGEFLLSTVTLDSIDWIFFKKYAAVFDLPRHMVYFRKKQLKTILAKYFSEIEFACQTAPIDYYRSAAASKKCGGYLLSCMAYTIVGSYVQNWLAKKEKTTRVSIRCKK